MSRKSLDSPGNISEFSPFSPLGEVINRPRGEELESNSPRVGRYFKPPVHDGDVFVTPDLFDEQNFFNFSATPRGVHWSIAWSDLMMTMFIFFLVMFVFSVQEQGKSEREGLVVLEKEVVVPQEQDQRSLVMMYDFSKQLIDLNALENFAAIELQEDHTLRLVLTGDLLFASGKAKLLPAARGALRQIARLLTQTAYRITVVGHTDNLPISSNMFPSNWELSAARAGAVARFLISETRLPATRFQVSGFASYQPVSSLDTDEGRARNRRVEIVVSRADIITEPINFSERNNDAIEAGALGSRMENGT